MSTIYVLMVVLAIGSSTSGSQHPLTGFSTQFSSQERCETARENVRQKVNRAYVVLLTCEKQ